MASFEAKRQLIMLAMGPAVMLARAVQLPLDDLLDVTSIEYVRQLRTQGFSIEQVARRIRKSPRTVATLLKLDKVAPEGGSKPLRLRRMIVRWLTDHPGHTFIEIAHALSRHGGPEEVRDELLALREQGVVTETAQNQPSDPAQPNKPEQPNEPESHGEGATRLYAHGARMELVDDDMPARLAGVRHFFDVVGQAIYGRFFSRTPSDATLVRAMSFSASRASAKQLGLDTLHALTEKLEGIDAEVASLEQPKHEAHVIWAVVQTPADPFFKESAQGAGS